MRGRFHAGVVRDTVRPVGRGAGGAGRDGHGLGARARAAPALAGRHGRAGVRVRAQAGAGARARLHARRPQHAGHHLRPARLLPQPAGASADIRCDSTLPYRAVALVATGLTDIVNKQCCLFSPFNALQCFRT